MATRYYSSLRPLDIGCFPKYPDNKVIDLENFDDRTYVEDIQHGAWGWILYEKPIPEKDADSYDLMIAENWQAGSKVFRTENEAWDYAKAISDFPVGVSKTDKPVTHRHLGDGMTEEV